MVVSPQLTLYELSLRMVFFFPSRVQTSPHALEKDLARSAAILWVMWEDRDRVTVVAAAMTVTAVVVASAVGVSVSVLQTVGPRLDQLVTDMFRTTAAFEEVVVYVAIGIGRCKGTGGGWEVPSKSSLASTMFALHSWKSHGTILDFGPSTGSIFFGESTCLHLIQQQEQVVGDKLTVFRFNDGTSCGSGGGGSPTGRREGSGGGADWG